MNNQLSLEFSQEPRADPDRTESPHIRHADVLEVDWADMLPPDECS